MPVALPPDLEVPMSRTAVVPLLLLALACNGPLLLLPGGALEGESKPPPSDWSFAGDAGTAQLETRPADPYSVNIAYTILDGSPYVNAGDTETEWVKNMTTDPNVRLRVEGAVYELRAERVNDGETLAKFAKAWTDQSMFRRDPTELEQVYLYRLVPR
jgi:hypothetical protein